MTGEPEGSRAALNACPYLGLEDDRSSHRLEPTEVHRCYAGPSPIQVDTERQTHYCLSSRFVLCPRQVLGAPEELPKADAEEIQDAAGKGSTSGQPSGRAWRTPVLAVAGSVLLLSIAAVIIVANPFAAPAGSSAPSAAPVEATAPPNPRPERALIAAGTAEPGPTAAPATSVPPVAKPAPSPTVALGIALTGGSATEPTAVPPSPVPTESALRTYLVPYGDTLSKISARFGVPIEDIMRANDIPDRDLILTGRTLVIPNPR